ncbi:hypothetical protein ZWY2020_056742 [Hordeum vulgare]|nr:hypothetical protein ZWY2020_056742 [Hordeum vulgare]
MHVDHAVSDAMEPLLHEISKRELEMSEPSDSNKRLEELRVAQEDVEKCMSVEELTVEYQRELWWCHYYEYDNDEGDADEEDVVVVKFSLGDPESSTGGMSLLPLELALVFPLKRKG